MIECIICSETANFGLKPEESGCHSLKNKYFYPLKGGGEEMKRLMVNLVIFALFVVGNYIVFTPRPAPEEPTANIVSAVSVSTDSPVPVNNLMENTNKNNPDQPTRLVIAVGR